MEGKKIGIYWKRGKEDEGVIVRRMMDFDFMSQFSFLVQLILFQLFVYLFIAKLCATYTTLVSN